ncbi:MAG: hypothetical protein P8N09_11555, partial [Planctomycetota bacterium]|nr:hypothetical protein [Planctomycetota bacterium]
MTSHQAMVEKLLRAGQAAGQDKLAQLAYQMARTCVSIADSGTAGKMRWFEDPLDVTSLRDEMGRMNARTGSTLQLDPLPLANPTASSAVEVGRTCLDFAEGLEGSSERVQYLQALFVKAEGGVEEAADRLLAMLNGPLTKAWYRLVQGHRQHTLAELGQHELVAEVGRGLLKYDPMEPVGSFNLLIALAWMGQDAEFERSVDVFRASLVGVSDPDFWAGTVADEAEWFAEQLGRDPDDIMKRMLPPGLLDAGSGGAA